MNSVATHVDANEPCAKCGWVIQVEKGYNPGQLFKASSSTKEQINFDCILIYAQQHTIGPLRLWIVLR